MRVVGIRALRVRLSEYLRLVGSGEIILVTNRERVVAILQAPSEEQGPAASGAVRSALLNHPTRPRAPLPARRPVARLREVLADLEEDRADRC